MKRTSRQIITSEQEGFWTMLKRKIFRTPRIEPRNTIYMFAILPMNSLMIQIMIDLLSLFKLQDILSEQLSAVKDQVGHGTMAVTLTVKDDDITIRQKVKRMLRLMSYNELSTAPTYYADSIEVLSVWRYHDPSQFDLN